MNEFMRTLLSTIFILNGFKYFQSGIKYPNMYETLGLGSPITQFTLHFFE